MAHDSHAPVHGEPQTSVYREVHDHPSMTKYIVIGVVLTILTAVEVVVYLIEELRGILVPLLFALAAAKFFFVAGWYMHLRFDPKLMTWLFVGGLGIATATIAGLWALQNGWGG